MKRLLLQESCVHGYYGNCQFTDYEGESPVVCDGGHSTEIDVRVLGEMDKMQVEFKLKDVKLDLWWCKTHRNAVKLKEFDGDWDEPMFRRAGIDYDALTVPFECALVAGDREGLTYGREDCKWEGL